jgi:hypothetical protein
MPEDWGAAAADIAAAVADVGFAAVLRRTLYTYGNPKDPRPTSSTVVDLTVHLLGWEYSALQVAT